MILKIFYFFAGLWLVVAPLSGQVTLELKLRENTQQVGRVETNVRQLLTLGVQELKSKVKQEMMFEIGTGKRSEDGSLKQTTTHTSLVAEFEFPGGIKMEFDSRAPKGKAPLQQLEMVLDGLREMMKARVVSIFDKDNKIREVEILNEDDIVDNPFVKDELAPKTLLARYRQEFGRLPDKAVSRGDTWVRNETVSLGSGQTMTYRVDYEYQGEVKRKGRGLDRITGKITSVDYSRKEDAAGPLKVKDSELKPVKSGIEVLFDRRLAAIVEVSQMVQIKGDMTFEVNGMNLPGKLDLIIENSMNVGLKKK